MEIKKGSVGRGQEIGNEKMTRLEKVIAGDSERIKLEIRAESREQS